MRIIEEFDSKNYDTCVGYFHRVAVRAVIIKEGKLALIKSQKYGEFKFPGGGKENGETDIDTLIRETMEETGLTVVPKTIMPYGVAKEKRKSRINPNNIFQMESYYYLCEVLDQVNQTNLDDYEDEYGYQLHFIDIDEAIQTNEIAAVSHQIEAPWINRELAVFKDIKKYYDL